MGLAMVAQIRVIRERWATRLSDGMSRRTDGGGALRVHVREPKLLPDSSSENESCDENNSAAAALPSEVHHKRSLELNMRVGVHSGTVVAGVIGQRRFQFDVFGVDVLIANKMESCGRPGHVVLLI